MLIKLFPIKNGKQNFFQTYFKINKNQKRKKSNNLKITHETISFLAARRPLHISGKIEEEGRVSRGGMTHRGLVMLLPEGGFPAQRLLFALSHLLRQTPKDSIGILISPTLKIIFRNFNMRISSKRINFVRPNTRLFYSFKISQQT